MISSTPHRIKRLGQLARWRAVVLALAGQLGANALAFPRGEPLTALETLAVASIICSASNHHDKNTPLPPHRHLADPAILAASHAAAHHFAVVETKYRLPARAIVRATQSMRPQARAPPTHPARAFHSQGPPRLS